MAGEMMQSDTGLAPALPASGEAPPEPARPLRQKLEEAEASAWGRETGRRRESSRGQGASQRTERVLRTRVHVT